jgi:hypothetical protein
MLRTSCNKWSFLRFIAVKCYLGLERKSCVSFVHCLQNTSYPTLLYNLLTISHPSRIPRIRPIVAVCNTQSFSSFKQLHCFFQQREPHISFGVPAPEP